jgi:hypothetical protein
MTSDGREGKVVPELEEADRAIRALRSDNDRLYGLVSSLMSESIGLRQGLEDLARNGPASEPGVSITLRGSRNSSKI